MSVAVARVRDELPPLVLEVGHQGDGNAFRLDSASQARILDRFPGAAVARSLFLGTYGPQDLARLDDNRWREIGKLLTGLSDEQIEEMGGLLVFDPVHRQTLRRG